MDFIKIPNLYLTWAQHAPFAPCTWSILNISIWCPQLWTLWTYARLNSWPLLQEPDTRLTAPVSPQSSPRSSLRLNLNWRVESWAPGGGWYLNNPGDQDRAMLESVMSYYDSCMVFSPFLQCNCQDIYGSITLTGRINKMRHSIWYGDRVTVQYCQAKARVFALISSLRFF